MSASVLAPGVVIADTYEVERLLGQGGMGEVWLARHRRLSGKQVAIKVLRTHRQLGSDALARFRHEAEIAVRLEHPNIVQVLDFNALATGEPFLVMEYLKGTSLAQRLQEGRSSLEQVTQVVRQVGSALQAAHRAGVVHRDLKPENIFLVPNALGDQVKVLDFGISKLADSKTVQTNDAVLIGTPLYMSPEQALGNNRDVTAQSDIFSLAGIAYEMFTGVAPFAAESVAKVVFRIAYEKHRPLIELRPDLPLSVSQAVERGLAKDRTQRTPDMAAFVVELTGLPLAELTALNAAGPGGVATPETPVSASMWGGATVSRGSKDQATPAPAPAPSGTAPLPAPRSSSKLAVVALAIAAVGVGGALFLRGNEEARPSGSLDAGALVKTAPVLAPATTPALDASTAPTVAEAVVTTPTPDAGSRAPPPPKQPPPPGRVSEAEQRYVRELQALYDAGKLAELLERRQAIRRELPSNTAYVQGISLLIRAICQRHDDRHLTLHISELKTHASPATFAREKRTCLAVWPDVAVRWED